MSATTYRYPSTYKLWFGVLGGGVAWLIEFAAGIFFTYAQCSLHNGRTHLPVREWQTGIAAGGVVVALLSMYVCVRIYLGTHGFGDVAGEERRGDGHPPPLGRIHFLAVCGLLVNLLVIAIMVMTAIAAPQLTFCQQQL